MRRVIKLRTKGHFFQKSSSQNVPRCSKNQIQQESGRIINLNFSPLTQACPVAFRGLGHIGADAGSPEWKCRHVITGLAPSSAGNTGQVRNRGRCLLNEGNGMQRMDKTLKSIGLIAAAAIYMTAATDASAQSSRNCGPRIAVVERLAEGYGETRQSVGLGANNAVVEVFASEETGSWTITITRPGGLTCLVASGQAFEEVAEALPTSDEDA
jgi:hypothetical protein